MHYTSHLAFGSGATFSKPVQVREAGSWLALPSAGSGTHADSDHCKEFVGSFNFLTEFLNGAGSIIASHRQRLIGKIPKVCPPSLVRPTALREMKSTLRPSELIASRVIPNWIH
jgi:hypothetical protein